MKKEATSYRLSVDVKGLIRLLAPRLGVNETSVIELAVRELAERKGVQMARHVIGIGFESYTERKNALPTLNEIFENVSSMQNNKQGIHVICSKPIGKTYDEAFEICRKKYVECGWINVDSL